MTRWTGQGETRGGGARRTREEMTGSNVVLMKLFCWLHVRIFDLVTEDDGIK